MKQKACVDRLEGGLAVLLVRGKPRVFARSLLPEGTKKGDWLQVEIVGGKLVSAQVDAQETAQAAVRIKEKLAKLRRGVHRK